LFRPSHSQRARWSPTPFLVVVVVVVARSILGLICILFHYPAKFLGNFLLIVQQVGTAFTRRVLSPTMPSAF
jgi:hypothetical protein